jgi:hypothetical protein
MNAVLRWWRSIAFFVAVVREARAIEWRDSVMRAQMLADGRPMPPADASTWAELSERFAWRTHRILAHGPASKAPENAASAAGAALLAWLKMRGDA